MRKTLGMILILVMTVCLIGCGGGSGSSNDNNNDSNDDDIVIPNPLDQGLQAYYPFDGDANDLINGNNGTVTGAVLTEDRKGNAEKAYCLDGVNDTISFPHHIAQYGNGGNAISVSVWVKPEGSEVMGAVIIKASCFEISENMGPNTYPQGLNYIFQTDGEPPFRTVVIDEGQDLNDWIHVVGTFDGSKIKIYLNSVLKGETDITGLSIIDASSDPMYIGGEDMDSYIWHGSIDDLRIYDRALSADEILSLYNK